MISIQELQKKAHTIREDIIKTLTNAHSWHITQRVSEVRDRITHFNEVDLSLKGEDRNKSLMGGERIGRLA